MNKSKENATVSNINLLMRFCRLSNANLISLQLKAQKNKFATTKEKFGINLGLVCW